MNELCDILPRVDHYDYFDFRQGKISLEEMKLKAMKIEKGFIVTRKDLIDKGVPLEYFI